MSAEAAAASPQKLKAPLVIGMVAAGLALGMATGVTLVGPSLAKKMGKVATAQASSHETPEAKAEEGGGGEHGGEHGGEGGAPSAAAQIHLVENLVLNPAGSGGGRFLLFSVGIEVSSASKLASIKDRDAELRDIVLTRIGKKGLDELTDVGARDAIKTELKAAIDERFGPKTVQRLFFPQFVVQ